MRRPERRYALVLGVALFAAGCAKESPRPPDIPPGRLTTAKPTPTMERRIERLYPAETRAGVPFNLQPDGVSAIAVAGTGFNRSDVIYWDGKPLATVFGNPALLTAVIPAALIAAPATVAVEVRSADPPQATRCSAVFKVLP
jgi:hypothetical protein